MIIQEGPSNWLRKTIKKGINTWDYYSGKRDSKYDYTRTAGKSDLKKTILKDYVEDFIKGSWDAKKDPDNGMIRFRLDAERVPDKIAEKLRPSSNSEFLKYMTYDKDYGYIILELPMNGTENNEEEDQPKDNPDQSSKGKSDNINPETEEDWGDGADGMGESMMTPVQVPYSHRTLQCDEDGHLIIRESYDMKNLYKEIKSKLVEDIGGFLTDYTMYYDIENDKYIFIFGDSEIYTPDNSDIDFECETREEAEEWFDDYRGPGFEDEYNEEDWESRTDRFDDIESPYYNGDLEDSDFEEESINYGGATSGIPASKPSSLDLIDVPGTDKEDGLQLRVDEDFNFGGNHQKGDELFIHFNDPDWDGDAYARVEYIGKTRDGKFKFRSTTYGDIYIVDFKNNTVETPDRGNGPKTFTINDETGWTKSWREESITEDYWFGGDGKIEEPDQSLEDNQPLELNVQDITKEDEDQDKEDATESVKVKESDSDGKYPIVSVKFSNSRRPSRGAMPLPGIANKSELARTFDAVGLDRFRFPLSDLNNVSISDIRDTFGGTYFQRKYGWSATVGLDVSTGRNWVYVTRDNSQKESVKSEKPEDDDPDESVGLKDPKDEKKSVTLNEDPVKSELKISLDDGKVYEYVIRSAKKSPKKDILTYVKENLHTVDEDIKEDTEEDDDRPLRVCDHCLMGIEAHEGRQFTRPIYFDDDDEDGKPDGVCDWCGESGFDELNEITGSLDESVKLDEKQTSEDDEFKPGHVLDYV